MATKRLPPKRVLDQLFDYDPDTGILAYKGGRPVKIPSNGRRSQVRALGGTFLIHRVAWKMVTGRDPVYIDHINRDWTDNRFSNLRSCTKSENAANSRRRGGNLKGVTFHDRGWEAKIMVRGKARYLGFFPTEAEAHAAYCEAGRKAFGAFFHDGH